MVVGILRIPLSQDRRLEALFVLPSIQEHVRAQPGCRGYNIDQESLEEHLRAEACRRMRSTSTCGWPNLKE
jgi:quinol monooxygenase YgiN